jgi:hypothetical protein
VTFSIFSVIFALSGVPRCTYCNDNAICNPLNYWRLRIEGGPLFRRLLKSQLGTGGVWVASDSGNPPAAGEGVEVRIDIATNVERTAMGAGNFRNLRGEIRRS